MGFVASIASGVTCNNSNLNVTFALSGPCNAPIVTAVATGGIPNYSYSWTPSGGTGAVGSGLITGNTYTVTVSDNSCLTKTASITVPSSSITATIANVQPGCISTTGTASLTVTGGTPVYTYLWSPSGGTGAGATGLATGTTYTVTVTDSAGCIQTATTTINTVSNTLALTTTSIPAVCTALNGSATVSVAGGTAAFSYLWAPGGSTAATASGLVAGTYTVTVTDANGCSKTTSATVLASSGTLAASAISTPAVCITNNGTATATVTGGAAAYTYLWAPSGGTGSTANNLAAGTYTVTVTDANGCINTASTTVLLSSGTLGVTASTTPSICTSNNGTATANVTGGTAVFTYLWSPVGATGSTANNLTPGTYTVTVTDANSCSKTATATVIVTNGTLWKHCVQTTVTMLYQMLFHQTTMVTMMIFVCKVGKIVWMNLKY